TPVAPDRATLRSEAASCPCCEALNATDTPVKAPRNVSAVKAAMVSVVCARKLMAVSNGLPLRRWPFSQSVSFPTDRLDPPCIIAQLVAQAADVDVHDAGAGVEFEVPHVKQEGRPRDRLFAGHGQA